MRSFFKAMLDCREEIYEKRDRPAADIYSTVESFLKEGNYSSYRNANALAEMKLNRRTDTYIATQLGISEATVRVHTRNVSNELYSIFGASFLSQLSNYKENRDFVNSVMYRIKYRGKMAISYILSDVVLAIKGNQPNNQSYELQDCHQEIDFLRRYSNQFLQSAMHEVDMDKLKFLIGVLDGKAGKPEDWYGLISNIVEEI